MPNAPVPSSDPAVAAEAAKGLGNTAFKAGDFGLVRSPDRSRHRRLRLVAYSRASLRLLPLIRAPQSSSSQGAAQGVRAYHLVSRSHLVLVWPPQRLVARACIPVFMPLDIRILCVPKNAEKCPKMPKNAKKCQKMPKKMPKKNKKAEQCRESRSTEADAVDAPETCWHAVGHQRFAPRVAVWRAPQAVTHYTTALGALPTAVTFANRAMARLKLRQHAEAEADCSQARQPPRWSHGLQRSRRKELNHFSSQTSHAFSSNFVIT